MKIEIGHMLMALGVVLFITTIGFTSENLTSTEAIYIIVSAAGVLAFTNIIAACSSL